MFWDETVVTPVLTGSRRSVHFKWVTVRYPIRNSKVVKGNGASRGGDAVTKASNEAKKCAFSKTSFPPVTMIYPFIIIKLVKVTTRLLRKIEHNEERKRRNKYPVIPHPLAITSVRRLDF